MAHWRRQPGRMLGLAAVVCSLLLVQKTSASPSHASSADLNPRVLYHNAGSLFAAVVAGSSHIVKDLETLYELRQLALEGSPAATSSGHASRNSPSRSSAQETFCNYHATPSPSGTAHRCPAYGPASARLSPAPHC
jgi:hypothetical protein